MKKKEEEEEEEEERNLTKVNKKLLIIMDRKMEKCHKMALLLLIRVKKNIN